MAIRIELYPLSGVRAVQAGLLGFGRLLRAAETFSTLVQIVLMSTNFKFLITQCIRSLEICTALPVLSIIVLPAHRLIACMRQSGKGFFLTVGILLFFKGKMCSINNITFGATVSGGSFAGNLRGHNLLLSTAFTCTLESCCGRSVTSPCPLRTAIHMPQCIVTRNRLADCCSAKDTIFPAITRSCAGRGDYFGTKIAIIRTYMTVACFYSFFRRHHNIVEHSFSAILTCPFLGGRTPSRFFLPVMENRITDNLFAIIALISVMAILKVHNRGMSVGTFLTRRRKCRNLEQTQAHGQGEEQGQTALENVFLISHYILPFFAGIRMQSIRRPGWHGAMCAL